MDLGSYSWDELWEHLRWLKNDKKDVGQRIGEIKDQMRGNRNRYELTDLFDTKSRLYEALEDDKRQINAVYEEIDRRKKRRAS